MKRQALPFLILFLALTCTAQKKLGRVPKIGGTLEPRTVADAGRLPVKRVVLYKNGVGYFEHSARVTGNQELNIDFTTAQLNDVLKSLTVVDLGEGRISSVRYNSIAPLDERLKTLRLPFGEQVSRADFLAAMRGARVEVRSGSTNATGRLLSVEKERRSNGKGEYVDVTEFSLVSDSGEMRNFELNPSTSVRLAERDLGEEVGRYLNLVGSSRARDLRRMTISATGTGERDVFVSYISEVPVWKSTYRIILSEKADQKPLLQGWAIVDNTVGEDWKDVQLSLVAGAPQSFIQQISQPYYTRRPIAGLPESMMLTPQSHEGTLAETPGATFDRLGRFATSPSGLTFAPGTGGLEGTVKDQSGAAVPGAKVTIRNEETGASQSAVTDATGVYRIYNVTAGNSALFVEKAGFQRYNLTNFYLGVGRMNEIHATLTIGGAMESVEVTASAPVINTETSMISLNNAAQNQHVEAVGKTLGDFFEYNLKQKITIGKNQSALVPILQAHITAEKVSLWNENAQEIRRALWITNTSGLTLDSGTFDILQGETFAGEGLLETVLPAERRLISYAADPALRIAMDENLEEKPVRHVRIVKGVMTLTHEQRDRRKYTIRNSDKEPRDLVIEHPAREGWKLAEGPKPEESTVSFLRFRVSVPPDSSRELNLEEIHPREDSYELDELDDKQVTLISDLKSMTPALRDAFGKVIEKKNEIGVLDNQLGAHQKEVAAITKDQERLRENMKALKGSAEEKALVQRYTRQLDSQEDRLAALQKETDSLNDKKTKADEELDRIVQAITLDEKF